MLQSIRRPVHFFVISIIARYLRHEITLLLHKLFPDGLTEFHAVLAAAINHHGFRPYLIDVGAGGFFVIENVTFSLFTITQHWQKSPVPRKSMEFDVPANTH